MWCRCKCVEARPTAAALTLAAILAATATPVAAQTGVAIAPLRTFKVELDGGLSEWEELPAITFDSSSYLLTAASLYEGNADLSGTVRFTWDTTHLYVAGRFADDSVARGAAWTSDRVNLVFDLRNDNHPLSYGGQPPDAARWQADDHWVYAHIFGDGDPPYPVMRMSYDYHGPIKGARLLSTRRADGWAFELQVPWSELPEAQPFVGAVLGMQVFVSDGDGLPLLTEVMWSERWGYSLDAGLSWELWKMGELVLTGEALTGGARCDRNLSDRVR